MKTFGAFLSILVICVAASLAFTSHRPGPQQQQTAAPARSLAERLGYPAGAKLLIIHADDVGLAHSVNAATITAMKAGVVNSASVMVPCPWFPEIAAHAREHPELDIGLHLTLTSEWKHYRWGSVLPRGQASTLHDAQGFLHAGSEGVAKNADPAEAERELRAQVERARAFGINPTHLDTHMGSLFQTRELFEAYLRVARHYRIPAMVPREPLERGAPHLLASLRPEDILIDRIVMAQPGLPAGEWKTFYTRAIETLRPGVTELIIHLARDDEEMRAVAVDHPDFGSAWRQRDLDFFTSPEVRQLLDKQNVRLVTWREIGKLIGR